MARRGLNIYKRKDGRWEGRYKIGYNENGKAKYTSVYGKSYSAVKSLLEKKRAEVNSYKKTCKHTVGEIISVWLPDLKFKVKESTYANYVMKLEKHILPIFSNLKYDMLTVKKLNDFIQCKLNEGLSEKYTADIVILLKSIAKFACKTLGYANAIEYVTLPKTKEITEKKLLSESEQKKLRKELIKSDTLTSTGILLASVTGMRIGELCALKWADLDLEKSIITVRHTVQRIKNLVGDTATKLIETAPKSSSSARKIPIPDFILPLLKKKQSAKTNYILTQKPKCLEPRTLQYRFKSFLKKIDLPDVNFHSLRHIFATNCISLGFDVKTLSEILGHSSVEITLNRYVHSSLDRKKNCMKLLSNSLCM